MRIFERKQKPVSRKIELGSQIAYIVTGYRFELSFESIGGRIKRTGPKVIANGKRDTYPS